MSLSDVPPGEYHVEALFADNPKRVWAELHGEEGDQPLLGPPVQLGQITIAK
jgi:hypothetical protein